MAPPKARRNTTIIAWLCYLITIPFLVLVLIGNTHINGVLNDIYFFKLDVSHIIPIAVENSQLLNSVARSLGLHDFYSVGLWNFCEGYLDEGVTFCSRPKQYYWFNPVEVLVSELLAGAKIALPSQVITILTLLRIGSQVMYGCFMAGTILNAILLVLTPLATRRRLFSLFISIIGLLSVITLAVASVIATVISVAARIALTAQDQLNISADIGIKMFVFMWIGTLVTLLAFLLHSAMGCFCRPQRIKRSSSSKRSNGSMAETSSSNHNGSLPRFMSRKKTKSSSPKSSSPQ
ncbi:integral membrane protein [Cordyceps fumosorosea ARSEF 2679]|uniref:Integral membrane protein n=1 Tax=Cordyceps fumosorosea (strain ARSEF 2679) TaxID=1081104 RepID=A0A167JT06_CORFA|nr:integral membrane protein [Cordyceps fumosorosea ARSEF 2679]OAA50711.1 integral membrane protein [Cordyceps fumosorosea ARSEF 2679]